jgi:hypothetical protein
MPSDMGLGAVATLTADSKAFGNTLVDTCNIPLNTLLMPATTAMLYYFSKHLSQFGSLPRLDGAFSFVLSGVQQKLIALVALPPASKSISPCLYVWFAWQSPGLAVGSVSEKYHLLPIVTSTCVGLVSPISVCFMVSWLVHA